MKWERLFRMGKIIYKSLGIILVCMALITGCGSQKSVDNTSDSSKPPENKNSSENSPSGREETAQEENPENNTSENMPEVYMTTDISPEGLMRVYEALQWVPQGTVAVKLSTGEPPASNYLRPEPDSGFSAACGWNDCRM